MPGWALTDGRRPAHGASRRPPACLSAASQPLDVRT